MWTLFMALRYFRSRGRERMISVIGLISVLGIALGVASLIVVLSVMNGFDREVRDKIIGTYSHIIITSPGGLDPEAAELNEALSARDDIIAWAPFISGQGILRTGDYGTGTMVKGIDPPRERRVTDLDAYTEGARVLEPGMILVGREILRESRLEEGDELELVSPYSALDIERKNLEVAGSFTTGRYDYDANMVLIHLADARELFRTGEVVTGLGLRISDAMKAQSLKRSLSEELFPHYHLRSWMQLDENLVRALALEKKIMFVILTLIIVIACFNIAGSLIMMVMEKTRDIGILKALGATDRAVSMIFMAEAALTGLIRVLLGLGAGQYIARNVNEILDGIEHFTGFHLFPSDVYYFTDLPVKIMPSDLVMISVVAMALTLFAGLYPARRAAALEPVEAIRYE